MNERESADIVRATGNHALADEMERGARRRADTARRRAEELDTMDDEMLRMVPGGSRVTLPSGRTVRKRR